MKRMHCWQVAEVKSFRCLQGGKGRGESVTASEEDERGGRLEDDQLELPLVVDGRGVEAVDEVRNLCKS
jgi:hypothetical protein